MIVNCASGTTPPDVVITVSPNLFLVGYIVDFSPGRMFKVKNNSAQPLEWSLSTLPNSYSTPPLILAPNSISQQLSISIAPNGDKLLFHNTSLLPVEVEITILEE